MSKILAKQTSTIQTSTIQTNNPKISDFELPTKVYIKIPFNNKDTAKNLGCRWEPEKKSWFYMSNHDKNKIEGIKKLEA
jgi:hypothetical protein